MFSVKVLWEAAIEGVKKGLMPTMEAVRRDREARDDWQRNFLLDWLLDLAGAVIGMQQCGQKITCRAGRGLQRALPAAPMALVLAESFVPTWAQEWYGVLRRGVLSRRFNIAMPGLQGRTSNG